MVPSGKHVPIKIKQGVAAGLNTPGLSCDMQTLIGTTYPSKPDSNSGVTGVLSGFVCDWALSSFSTVAEVHSALSSTHSVHGPDALAFHFIFRDALGESLVVEFLPDPATGDPRTNLHLDLDDGESGFGITTNEPPFPWHVTNVLHYEWKRSLSRPAVAVPGGFYPDERFLRLHSLKNGLEDPASYEEHVQNAVHLLNAVTIPKGDMLATDSGAGEGEGDHTIFGLVYDHDRDDPKIYFRSYDNQSMRRLRLADLKNLDDVGGDDAFMPVAGGAELYYIDAAADFRSKV